MPRKENATDEHEKLHQALLRTISVEGASIPAVEVLAVVSNLVGKLVALLDQREITPDQALAVVSLNMEHGNRQVIEQLRDGKGTMQ